MLTGIDHVIVAVHDLDAAAEAVERELGLRVSEGGRHAAHGTHNRLAWLGDAYLELMAIFDDELAAESWWGRHAQAAIQRGGGLMGVVLASDDIGADAAQLRGLGSPLLAPSAGERARPDGDAVRWQIARLPEPVPQLGLMFLIEHDVTAAEWGAADRAARAEQRHPAGTTARLLRVEVPVDDVRGTTQRLLHGLGLQFRPSLAGGGARDTSIGAQVLRLRSAASSGPPTIVIRAGVTERALELLGCRWQLLPA